MKALAQATKTQVRMNERGVLNLQHIIYTDNDLKSFVDFFVMPLEEEDEDSMN